MKQAHPMSQHFETDEWNNRPQPYQVTELNKNKKRHEKDIESD